MKVLVCGSRRSTSYEDRMWLYAGLSLLHSMKPITEVIEGGAPGFDLHARNWALWRIACGDRLNFTTVNAEWEKHGKAAGPIRNTQMAKMRPDIVLAAPGGDGTASMIEIAKAHGLKVVYLEKMPVIRAKKNPPTIRLAIGG